MADISLKFGVQGEQTLKSSLDAINSQIKYLNADMKLAVTEMGSMTSAEEKNARQMSVLKEQAEAYKSKLALLNTNYDKQKEKLQALKDNLDKVSKSTGENSTETKKAQEEYNKQVKAVNNLGAELKKTETNLKATENSMDQLGKETSETTKELEKGEKGASTFGDTLKAKLTGEALISGIKKIGSALKELALGAITAADDLATQAQVTGLSTDALQEYYYMSELVDVSVDTITGSLTKLTKNMQTASSGTGDAYEAFERLNVSFLNVDGSLRNNQDVFNDLIDALGQMEEGTERDALSMTLFGKSAQDLNPLINAGSEAIRAYAQEAHDMGYVMSEEVIAKNAEASDALERMKNAVTSAKNEIGSAFAPVIQKAATALTTLIQKGKENKTTVEAIIKVVTAAVTAFVAYKAAVTAMSILDKMKAATESATVAQAALNAIMKANPIALVVTAITALVTALVLFTKRNKEANDSIKAQQKELDKLSEELDAQTESWKAVTKARDESIAQTNSEFKYYEQLYEELKRITDANGHVQDGYEERAHFITTQLSNALGIEINLQDGVIQNYKELQVEIDNVIVKKKAELQLKAQEEAYTQAIRNREEAAMNLIKAESKRNEAQEMYSRENAALMELEAEKAELLKYTNNDYSNYAVQECQKRINAKRDEVYELERQMNEFEEIYDEAERAVYDMTYAINQYESNYEYYHRNEFDKINTVNAEVARSYQSLSREERYALDDMYGTMISSASKLYWASYDTGKNVSKGLADGINANASTAVSAATSLASSTATATNQTLGVKSPSRVFRRIGEYVVQGFALGIKDEESVALDQMKTFSQDTMAAFSKASQGGFTSSGAKLTSVGGSPALQVGDNTYVIKLQLDGRDIAQNTTKYQNQWQRAYST